MLRSMLSVSAATLLTLGASLPAYGQRGVGEQVGMARQAVRPPVVTVEGKLVSVETGPCEKTTGFAGIGTHLMLEGENGQAVNLHLGPAAAVASYVEGLETGETIVAAAFRTDKMAADHYVAVKVTAGDHSLTLRDETLRPFWAGQRGAGLRRGGGGAMCPRGGPGRGRGYGPGYGQGPGYGRGYGYGPGYGYHRWNGDSGQPGPGALQPGRGYRGGWNDYQY